MSKSLHQDVCDALNTGAAIQNLHGCARQRLIGEADDVASLLADHRHLNLRKRLTSRPAVEWRRRCARCPIDEIDEIEPGCRDGDADIIIDAVGDADREDEAFEYRLRLAVRRR